MSDTIVNGMPLTTMGFIIVFALVTCALIYWRIRRALKHYRLKNTPELSFDKTNIQHPNSHKRTGSVTLAFKNNHGGEAIVKSLHLRIVDHGASVKAGQIRASQELPVTPVKFHLRSDTATYPITPLKSDPVRLKKRQSYKVSMLLMSDENHWYRMRLEVNWHSKRTPGEIITASSGQFYMEFPAV